MQKKLLKIYENLYSTFGPQNWWPAEDDFEVIVGAILTQSVSWKNVETAIENLKNQNLLNLEGILAVDKTKLGQLIRSTRYYNQKADKLKRFCIYIKQQYHGDIYALFKKDIYDMRRELLKIKGIGPETADSIILYAANKPIFVVDAYTQRIFSRLGLLQKNVKYKGLQDFFMDHLPHDVKLFNEYHALIVNLGKDYCKKTKPLCEKCPLNSMCNEVFKM